MVLVGILLVLSPSFPGLATLTIDTSPPEFVWVKMASGSSSGWLEISKDVNNPTPITVGEEYWFAVWVRESGSGIDGGVSLDVWSQGTIIAGAGLPLNRSNHIYVFYLEAFSWTPSVAGLYTIKLTVEDNAGHIAEETRYVQAKMVPVEVEGYFTINGQRVDETSSLLLDTRDVTFTYVVTSGTEGVESVTVNITGEGIDDTVTCQKTGSTWTATYTFPRDGTYEVKGEVHTVTGEMLVPMSLIVDIGQGGGLPFNPLQLLGVLLVALGLYIHARI